MRHLEELNGNDCIYDVVIVGAGPAGCSCALALKNNGLKVALVDKSVFPRGKVCGDAIPGRAIKYLKTISATFEQVFNKFPQKLYTKQTKFHYNGKVITKKWVLEAYTCTRTDFDLLLLNLVKEETNTEIFEGYTVDKVAYAEGVYLITGKNNVNFKAKVIVGAEGAHSVTAKCLTEKKMDRSRYGASVRVLLPVNW